ncbi:MAG: type II/IV secretion system ATPase subunit [Bacilli bacterium]|nr:type II/IV secretion system ATPase subunit [Bacilli bacterium]
MNETIFDKLDFGPLKPLLDNDDITDISYCNGGQIWIRSLTQGSIRVEIPGCTQEFMEKLAFQCSNVMGTTFNNAKPFLDAESSELRLNFVHQSIATNGIACVLRKTPAKIRLNKEKLMEEDYFTNDIHDFLIKCVQGHCNIMVCGETGSGKTEFVKYLASHTKENEKIITIEDTLELHLDKIYPHRDIVSMKTNNVASYSDVLVTCMRQNPKWILLSEVRSAEAVSAVRNSISSGHNILSTIHADKASAIPYRLYSLMETDLDVDQFLTTIYRYIQLGVHIKAYYSKKYGKFHRELDEVTEFYVDDNNKCQSNTIYRKLFDKEAVMVKPSAHLLEYLANQNIDVSDIVDHLGNETLEEKVEEAKEDKDDTTIPQTIASKPVQQEEKKVDEKDLGYSVMSDPSGEKLETEPPAPNTMFNSNNKQENIVNQNVNVETQAQVQPENQNQQQTIETQAVNQNIFPENQSIGITPQINNNNLVGNINSNEIVHPINNNNSIEQTNILPQTPTAQIFPESNLNSENNVVNTMENTTNNINESVQTQSTNVAQPLPQSNIGLGNTLMSGNNQNSLFDANNSDVNNENNVNEKPQGIINTLSVDDILNGQG